MAHSVIRLNICQTDHPYALEHSDNCDCSIVDKLEQGRGETSLVDIGFV